MAICKHAPNVATYYTQVEFQSRSHSAASKTYLTRLESRLMCIHHTFCCLYTVHSVLYYEGISSSPLTSCLATTGCSTKYYCLATRDTSTYIPPTQIYVLNRSMPCTLGIHPSRCDITIQLKQRTSLFCISVVYSWSVFGSTRCQLISKQGITTAWIKPTSLLLQCIIVSFVGMRQSLLHKIAWLQYQCTRGQYACSQT